ncbi:Hamartin protein-domain-containing protein [Xylariomycetidae sp. FL0641]|nr:Hamartin protein-domain-containing protein [Xylariomycetidae sp. FL0641]
MASAPTVKELIKAIDGFVAHPYLPLPDGVVHVIDSFLQKHEDKLDEGVSDKLNEELIALYNKDIVQIPHRYAAFVAILRRLRPVIGQPLKVLQWFEMLLPMLNHLTQEKGLAAEGQGMLLDVLTAEDDSDSSPSASGGAIQLAERSMVIWFKECEVLQNNGDLLQDSRERQVKEALILYGKKHPKDFMGLLDKFLCKAPYRTYALLLLSGFIQSQPPHLYLILQTPLFGNLVNCLQKDTSTTVVTLALTAMTMILPHVPSSLVPHLPALFNIYARLLFWERELSNRATDPGLSSNVPGWDKCSYSPEADDTTIPQLLHYFTVLYGLYPINFMDYIRKPQRYIRHAEATDADDIEVQPTEIRHASERFRQCHLLHENFYTLTVDSEKTDFGRWIKSEPAEVFTNCMALCQIGGPSSSPRPSSSPPGGHDRVEAEKDGWESALLNSSINIGMSSVGNAVGDNQIFPGSSTESTTGSRVQSYLVRQPSQSSHLSHREADTRPPRNSVESPTLSRQTAPSGSQTQLQDLINSNKTVKAELHQTLTNDSVPSLALSQHDSAAERPFSQLHPHPQTANTPSSSGDGASGQYAQLFRFVFLLYNDLVFERFMKQQHLTHIGELRRRHVREAASEAETQNLIIANRHLKQRLEEAKKTEIKVKTESEKSRTLAKKWEADIMTKYRALREEQRKWSAERTALQTALEAAKEETEKMLKLVCEAEVRELGWKQNMQSVEIHVGELERLRKEVESLTESERNLQAQEMERQTAMAKAAEADSRAELLSTRLQATEADAQQSRDLYESQIVVLKAKLNDALKERTERHAEGLKAQLESAMAASRAQQTELKKRVASLTSKNTTLQAMVLELQATMPLRSKSEVRPPAESEANKTSESESTTKPIRTRRHRGFSDPEVLEATSFNATPPLEPFSKSASNQSAGRPSTPSGSEAPSTSTRGSPSNERYFGRGGMQNLRKEKKDKKDDREKKRSTGLRGIRGFV